MISNNVVKICGGSGCLFKIHSDKYSYILTARHVIENENRITVTKYSIENDYLKEENIEIIGTPFFHKDPKKDAAILKVKYINEIEDYSRNDELNFNEKYKLIGHPRSRENKEFSIREDNLKLINRKPYGYIEAQIENNANYDEVIGHSGGGVFQIKDENIYLIGIQKSMSADEERESLGRVDVMPLSFFDEITEAYPNDLQEIIPEHVECFSKLKELVMPLKGWFVDSHVMFTRKYLRSFTDQIVKDKLTPKFIKNFFKERLLMYNESKNSLYSKGLWISWLEFLIIMNIYKDMKLKEEDLEEIFNQYRLIYSNTKLDWSEEIYNISMSDYKGLKQDGIVIIGTDSIPVHGVIPQGIVNDIVRAQPIPRSELKIDEAIRHPLVSYKLIHLNSFQMHCIINKSKEYLDFSTLNEEELKNKLKEEYNSLING